MLLDSYVLKKGFEELFNINHPGTPAPAGYLKRVSQSMAKIDPLLKTVQVRPSPPEALVQAYLIHIGDKSDTNFRKVLELKGIRKQDQPSLVELFHAHRDSPRNEHLPQSSPLLTSLQIQGSAGSHGGAGLGSISISSAAGMPSTSSLPARFDPSTFGSALMSAARDGVDRFGTPILGGGGSSNTPSGAMSPPQGNEGHAAAAAHLNDNLRNIGKFFKRDLGSFGGRFGGGGKSADEGR